MQTLNKLFFLILLITYTVIGFSADTPGDSSINIAKKFDIKPDKHNRRTPRGTVEGFLEAVSQDDLDRAVSYLNLEFIHKADRERRGKALSKRFESLLSSSGQLVASVLISEYINGNTQDGLDLNLDKIGTLYIDDKEIIVLLEQIKDQDSLPIWLFSVETLKNIPLTETVSTKVIDVNNFVPTFLQENKLIGVSIGHWLMIFLIVLFSYMIARIVIMITVAVIKKLAAKYFTEQLSVLLVALQIPARLWLSVYLFVNSLQYLSIPIILRQHFNSIAVGVYLLAFLILLWQITSIVHILVTERFKHFNSTGVLSILDFVKRSIRFTLIISGILIGLHLYDHNVTTGLAALGLGGLAIALGAQKTLENIAGSINVVADQSVSVGDFCKFNGMQGYVEEIGIRSTKVRTLARTVLTIPNAEFATHIIENCTKKDKYWYNHKIGIRYETSPDQIRYLLVRLRELLYSHPEVHNENSFAKLSEFGDACLVIEVYAYLKTTKYFDFVDIKEDINLRIIDIIHESGTSFAFPSQTIYLSKDKGLPGDLTAKAEQKVKHWREHEELNLPGFTEEKILDLDSTLDYPVKGSSLSKSSTDKEES